MVKKYITSIGKIEKRKKGNAVICYEYQQNDIEKLTEAFSVITDL